MNPPTPKGEKMTLEEIANKFCEFLDNEHPAPSSRWLNLVRLMKGVEDAAREEGRQEMRDVCTKHGHDEFIAGYAKGFAEAVARVLKFMNSDEQCSSTKCPHQDFPCCVATFCNDLRPTGSGEEK